MAIPNYKEEEVLISEVSYLVKKWVRAGLVIINNTYKSLPFIIYGEQLVEEANGTEKISNVAGLRKTMDAEATFPVIDINTGEVKGTATESDIYELLASHYIATALKRDENNETVKIEPYPFTMFR